MASLSDRIAEAEDAYHRLMKGEAVVEFKDSNGETLRYQPARKADLNAYIQGLKAQLAREQGQPNTQTSAPANVWM